MIAVPAIATSARISTILAACFSRAMTAAPSISQHPHARLEQHPRLLHRIVTCSDAGLETNDSKCPARPLPFGGSGPRIRSGKAGVANIEYSCRRLYSSMWACTSGLRTSRVQSSDSSIFSAIPGMAIWLAYPAIVLGEVLGSCVRYVAADNEAVDI